MHIFGIYNIHVFDKAPNGQPVTEETTVPVCQLLGLKVVSLPRLSEMEIIDGNKLLL